MHSDSSTKRLGGGENRPGPLPVPFICLFAFIPFYIPLSGLNTEMNMTSRDKLTKRGPTGSTQHQHHLD